MHSIQINRQEIFGKIAYDRLLCYVLPIYR